MQIPFRQIALSNTKFPTITSGKDAKKIEMRKTICKKIKTTKNRK